MHWEYTDAPVDLNSVILEPTIQSWPQTRICRLLWLLGEAPTCLGKTREGTWSWHTKGRGEWYFRQGMPPSLF